MPGIFISYRREDSSAYAGRLYDHLVEQFGKDRVFMDVDSIEPGVDFVEVLQNTVSSCDVLIAVIGQHWLTAADADGRRLDHPEDFVRVEISTALSRNVRVIPALVAGARMPDSHELPEALTPLAHRSAVEISDTAFLLTLSRLMECLETILPASTAPASPAPHRGPVQFSQPAAPPPVKLLWEKIPRWRKWLLLYRPHSFGGVVFRLLFLFTVYLDLYAAIQSFPEGAYQEFGSWMALAVMGLVAWSFAAAAHWFDQRAMQRRILSWGR